MMGKVYKFVLVLRKCLLFVAQDCLRFIIPLLVEITGTAQTVKSEGSLEQLHTL